MGNTKSKINCSDQSTKTEKEELFILWSKTFKKEVPKEFIAEEDILSIYKNIFPFGDCTLFVRFLFRGIKNNDEKEILFRSFFDVFYTIKYGSNRERALLSFKMLDTSQKDYITKEDVFCFLNAVFIMIKETCKTKTPEEIIEDIMEQIDPQNKGKITKEMFCVLFEGSFSIPCVSDLFSET